MIVSFSCILKDNRFRDVANSAAWTDVSSLQRCAERELRTQ